MLRMRYSASRSARSRDHRTAACRGGWGRRHSRCRRPDRKTEGAAEARHAKGAKGRAEPERRRGSGEAEMPSGVDAHGHVPRSPGGTCGSAVIVSKVSWSSPTAAPPDARHAYAAAIALTSPTPLADGNGWRNQRRSLASRSRTSRRDRCSSDAGFSACHPSPDGARSSAPGNPARRGRRIRASRVSSIASGRPK
jgi:hypothetical protein